MLAPCDEAFESTVLAQVSRQGPERLALLGLDGHGEEDCRFTFAQVLRWAAEVAQRIRREAPAGCGGGSGGALVPLLVALLLDRAPLVLAAIFGAWGAGAAVAAIPKEFPSARIVTMCEDAALVLTDAGAAPEQLRGRTVRLGPRPCGAPGGAAPGALSLPEPGDVCMVVYTSGSTGRPKGAVCDHRNLWHSVLCFGSSIGVSSESRLLWKTPYQWRTAEYELYPALCAGGSLCVAAEGAHKRPDYIAKVLGDFGVHALVTVPTVLDMLLGHLDGAGALAHVAAVGEPLPSRACRGFLRGGGPVLQNFYGLTETGMTVWRCDREPAGATAPAGRPQPGVRVCVLRGGGLLAASPLEEGEIFFGGIMALGYLVGGALSEDHFVPAPPASGLGAGARLFRSGDLGRWNDRGELEVMGRVDRQVKLHGVRVELQEIEAQLVEGRLCREAAVVPAREDPQTLVAFLVGAPGGCSEELGSALAERVPAYMVPPHFVSLPALPRLLNDKIDRDALRAHTVGLVTRAQAKRMLEDSLSAGGEASAALVHFVDSLGFQRAVQQSEFAQRRLLDNLLAFGMLNVILFHWYWYVLVVPRTYLPPWDEHRPGETVSLPPLPVASWVTFTYRMLTQEWVNGAFIIVAVHEQSPAELKRFTLRDAAVIMLYFYVASIPTLLSLFVPAPWNEYILSAETIQRWFLLVLALGKSYLVASHHLRVRPVLQVAVLLLLLLAVPPCLEGSCGVVKEVLLPTDWWPKCMACLATPKELACVTLYVAAAHARESRWLERCGPLAGLLIFALSCALASWAPASQMAIEYGRGSGTLVGRLARLLGLAFGVVQACGLAWALRGPFSRQLHLRWLARWALGSYLFNVNFLDLLFQSPQRRWSVLAELQGAGALWSGLLTWAAMLLPVAGFLLVAAPAFQLAFITWPAQLALRAGAPLAPLAAEVLRRAAGSCRGRRAAWEQQCGRPLLAEAEAEA